jgi:RecA/RadA recombinase
VDTREIYKMAGLLDDFCGDLQKSFKKKNDLMVLDPNAVHKGIYTGCLSIDTDVGPLAYYGRLTEIVGMESSGKSTLVTQIAREFKKDPANIGRCAVIVDTELAFDPIYAEALGAHLDDRFRVLRPTNAEETDVICTELFKKLGDAVGLLVIDSVAMTRTLDEISHMQGDSSQKSSHASFWGQFGIKLVQWASKHNTAIVLINQIRSKPMMGQNDKYSITNTGLGSGHSNTDTGISTTGGFGLKFYLSARFLLKFSSSLKEKVIVDESTGEIDDAKVANIYSIVNFKNKCTSPNKRAKYIIAYGEGTDDSPIIKDYLTSRGVISTQGSFVSYKGTNDALSFRVNGKIAFNTKFKTPEVLEDAKKQYIALKGGHVEAPINANAASEWGEEGLGATDEDKIQMHEDTSF